MSDRNLIRIAGRAYEYNEEEGRWRLVCNRAGADLSDLADASAAASTSEVSACETKAPLLSACYGCERTSCLDCGLVEALGVSSITSHEEAVGASLLANVISSASFKRGDHSAHEDDNTAAVMTAIGDISRELEKLDGTDASLWVSARDRDNRVRAPYVLDKIHRYAIEVARGHSAQCQCSSCKLLRINQGITDGLVTPKDRARSLYRLVRPNAMYRDGLTPNDLTDIPNCSNCNADDCDDCPIN